MCGEGVRKRGLWSVGIVIRSSFESRLGAAWGQCGLWCDTLRIDRDPPNSVEGIRESRAAAPPNAPKHPVTRIADAAKLIGRNSIGSKGILGPNSATDTP